MKVSIMPSDVIDKVTKSGLITSIVRQILESMNQDSALIETTIRIPQSKIKALRDFGIAGDVAAFLEHDVIECRLPMNVVTRVPVLVWNIKNF